MEKDWIYLITGIAEYAFYDVKQQKVKFFNDYLRNFEQLQDKPRQDIILITEDSLLSQSISSSNKNKTSNNTASKAINDMRSCRKKINNMRILKEILYEYNIFKNLFDINADLPKRLREAILNSKSFEEVINIIQEIYPLERLNPFFENFIFLGFLNLNENQECKLFEFYMLGLNCSKGIYYEFMLNDVTKTKTIEEQRLKEKTLILDKISHEFKNPLIVIGEVLE